MTGQEMTGKVDPLEKSRGIIHLILLGTLYRHLSLPRLCSKMRRRAGNGPSKPRRDSNAEL